jgi:GNAT superfamily N-acetyltransferase
LEKKHDAAMSATRRRLLMRPLHLLLRPLGYLELTDVYKIELTQLPALFEIPPYTIVEAQARGVEEIAADPSFDEPPAVVRTLSKQGHHCFVAKYGERIVAYNWIAFSPVQEEEYSCEPGPADAICLNAYTVAAHRGKGLHYLLLLTMLHFAARAGKREAYTAVSLYNRPSWKTHARMGWRRAFTIAYFRPNFTPGRSPWPLTRNRYPVRLDWSRHSWKMAKAPNF